MSVGIWRQWSFRRRSADARPGRLNRVSGQDEILAVLVMSVFLWVSCSGGIPAGMYETGKATMPALAPIFRGLSGSPSASLMFNVDWGEEYLPAILDILKEKMVKATAIS